MSRYIAGKIRHSIPNMEGWNCPGTLDVSVRLAARLARRLRRELKREQSRSFQAQSAKNSAKESADVPERRPEGDRPLSSLTRSVDPLPDSKGRRDLRLRNTQAP
jgi:hypothetical protein